jgi:hypothetical protein
LKWLVNIKESTTGQSPFWNIKPFKFGNSDKISVGMKSIDLPSKVRYKVFVANFCSGLPLKLNLSFLAVLLKFAFDVQQTGCFGH